LNHELKHHDRNRILLRFYKKLLELRRTRPALAHLDRENVEVERTENEFVMVMRRSVTSEMLAAVFNCGPSESQVPALASGGGWTKLIDSAETTWRGPGSALPSAIHDPAGLEAPIAPHSFALFARVLGDAAPGSISR
jgi:maltooligosyltrehalose trehalohydrolase